MADASLIAPQVAAGLNTRFMEMNGIFLALHTLAGNIGTDSDLNGWESQIIQALLERATQHLDACMSAVGGLPSGYFAENGSLEIARLPAS